MKIITKPIVIFLSLFIVGGLVSFGTKNSAPKKGESNYILVRSALMMRSGIARPNAALLIEGKKEIKENEELFAGNRTSGHACGYHYSIEFWKSSDELTDAFYFNQDCEEFMYHNGAIQSRMKGYIKQLETNPTHYIYNLKVPVSFKPEKVKKAFSSAKNHLFFLRGTTAHYTSLTFKYVQIIPIKDLEDRNKWQAEQDENEKKAKEKLESIIVLITQTAEIKEQSDISFPWQSFGGGKIEHRGRVTLKFENGTDLTKIKDLIKANNATVEAEYTPEYYFVQLVSETEKLETIKIELEGYSFVTGIFNYPGIE